MANPAWVVSRCDGGHDAATGCAQLLLPSATERLYLFGDRPQGMPESFWLTWPQCGRTIPVRAVPFWPLGNKFKAVTRKEGLGFLAMGRVALEILFAINAIVVRTGKPEIVGQCKFEASGRCLRRRRSMNG